MVLFVIVVKITLGYQNAFGCIMFNSMHLSYVSRIICKLLHMLVLTAVL